MTSVADVGGWGGVVASGTPEVVAEVSRSFTGSFLKGMLAKASGAREAAE